MASKRRKRYKACSRKVRHENPGAACAARSLLIRRHPSLEGQMTVYKCPFCHGWHVGRALRGSYIGRRSRGAQ